MNACAKALRSAVAWAALFFSAQTAKADPAQLTLDIAGVPGSLTIAAPVAPVAIATRLTIQRYDKQAWRPMDTHFEAIAACNHAIMPPPPPPCVTIEPDHPMVTAPWTGQACADQCQAICTNIAVFSGYYRFVARSCDGAQTFVSPIFTVGRPSIRYNGP